MIRARWRHGPSRPQRANAEPRHPTMFCEGLRYAALPMPVAIAAAVAFFVAMLGTLLRWLESRTYVLYLMSDTIFTWEFAHRQRPDWEARIEQFAHYLVDCARSNDADELVIVGHSSGSFLGFEILARALE